MDEWTFFALRKSTQCVWLYGFYFSSDNDDINTNNLENQTIFVLYSCKIIGYFACVVTFVIFIRGDGEKGTNLI